MTHNDIGLLWGMIVAVSLPFIMIKVESAKTNKASMNLMLTYIFAVTSINAILYWITK